MDFLLKDIERVGFFSWVGRGLDGLVTFFGDKGDADGVCTEELAIAAVCILEDESALGVGEPFAEDFVSEIGIFFDVFEEEMLIVIDEIGLAMGVGLPKIFAEELDLEGIIEKIVLVTKFPKLSGRGLGVVEDELFFVIVEANRGELFGYLGVGKIEEGGFVEIIEDLAVDSVFV